MNCIFCSIADGTLPSNRIFEDADTISFLDIHPLSVGHSLVIPRKHFRDVFEIPEEIAAAVGRTTARVALALERELRPDGLNVFQANRQAAGQEVFHYHAHLVPRWSGDSLFRIAKSGHAEGSELASTAARLRARVG